MFRITTPRIRLIDIAAHRNGISGAPFHVVLFDEAGQPAGTKVAVLFEAAHHCAVLDISKLAQGDIRFGSNSWRGDAYESLIRNHITTFEKGTL